MRTRQSGQRLLFQLMRTKLASDVPSGQTMEEIRARMAEIVQFLSDHRWIYDVQVTKLFTEQFWKTIPDEVKFSRVPRTTAVQFSRIHITLAQ